MKDVKLKHIEESLCATISSTLKAINNGDGQMAWILYCTDISIDAEEKAVTTYGNADPATTAILLTHGRGFL